MNMRKASIAIVLLASFLAATGAAAEPPAKKQGIVGYPPFPRHPPITGVSTQDDIPWSIRAVSFTLQNMRERPVEAEQMLEEFADKGFNCVILEARYILGEKGDPDFWDCPADIKRLISILKKEVDACHRYGMLAIHHLTVSLVPAEYLKRYPEQSQVSVINGEIVTSSYDRSITPHGACYNRPDFQRLFMERVERCAREAGVDGFMVDEVQFWTPHRWEQDRFVATQSVYSACGCPSCRARFKADTGYEMPAGQAAKAILDNYQNEVFRAWVKWRAKCCGDFFAAVRQAAEKGRNGPALMLGCYANPLAMHSIVCGMSLEEMGRGCNVIFDEVMPADQCFFYNWPSIVAELKYCRAVADSRRGSVLALYKQFKTTGQLLFAWLLNLFQGGCFWNNMHTNDWPRWEEQYSGLLKEIRSQTGIGILMSRTSRDLYGIRGSRCAGYPTTYHDYLGWAQALLHEQVPFTTILETDLNPRKLAEFGTIVLGDAACLSDEQIQALRRYVRKGGILIADFQSSLFDENGTKRDDFGLADVLGVSCEGIVSPPSALTKTKEHELTAPLAEQCAMAYDLARVKPGAGVEVLLRVKDAQGNESPALCLNRIGRGKAIYLAGPIGGSYALPPVLKGGITFEDKREIAFCRLMARAAKFENRSRSLLAVEAPEGVLVDSFANEWGRVISLLNCAGAIFKENPARIPADWDVTFPDVPGEVRLTLPAKGTEKAYLVSPDFEGAWQLTPKRTDRDQIEITLPIIPRFGYVYLPRGRRDYVTANQIPILESTPAFKKITASIDFQFPRVMPEDTVLMENQFEGGVAIRDHKGLRARTLYGPRSNANRIKAKFQLKEKPVGQVSVQIAGLNHNRTWRFPITVTINGKEIFAGEHPFLSDTWSTLKITVEDGVLAVGENVIEITNAAGTDLGPGTQNAVPWLMVNSVLLGKTGSGRSTGQTGDHP